MRNELLQVERRLLLRGGMSVGALGLLTGCDVSDSNGVDRRYRPCRGGTTACRRRYSSKPAGPDLPESEAVNDFPTMPGTGRQAPALDPRRIGWALRADRGQAAVDGRALSPPQESHVTRLFASRAGA